jgi:hypothetical protein
MVAAFDQLSNQPISKQQAERLSEHQLDDARRFMVSYWQRLVALGMPAAEARKVARAVARDRVMKQSKYAVRLAKVQALIPAYWRKLIELGVPIDDAKPMAEAIAEYDVLGKIPDSGQRNLMHQYCRFLCRAELWRSQLFIDTPTYSSKLPDVNL